MTLPPSPSPDFLAGGQAAFNAVLEEMQFLPPSKVGEARFTARLVSVKASLGAYPNVSHANLPYPVPPASDNQST